MNYIIYTKNANNQEYGLKEINNRLLKKLIYNEIHKKCRFSIPKEKITKEFGIHFEQENEIDLNIDSNINLNIDSNIDYDKNENNNSEINNLDDNLQINNLDDKKLNVDVLVMTELDEKQLETYLELYEDEKDNLEKFVEFLSIIFYNQINHEKFKIKKKFESILNSISEYWEDPYNCNYTLTDKFNKRKFNNMNYSGFDENVIQNIKSNFELNWNSREINYLNDIIKFNDWKEMCVHKYYISTKSKFNND